MRKRKNWIRYEILLPLRYNDGHLVEKGKFDETRREIINKFGGVTTKPITAEGHWLYEGKIYVEEMLQLVIDTEDKKSNRKFMQEYKEILKERFQQVEIWIIAYGVQKV